MQSIIQIDALSYQYPDGTVALDGISCQIQRGESVAVIGANGAGKSTLLAHLVGLLTPQQGQIRIGDHALTQQTLAPIRRLVGMVFQNPDDQLFMPTVWEDVAFGPLNLGLTDDEVNQRATKALAQVGALALRTRAPYKLSGGQKRAVSLAAVLAMQPEILVMDEPSAGLDSASRRQLINLFLTLEQTRVIVSHDLDLILDTCPRTIILKNARLLADGPSSVLLQDDKLLAAAGLEKPLRFQDCPLCKSRQHA
ncbi:ABC transporter ATP-binding protein [Azotosporobacter soli]|uniref:energy-coupling factor ABC transporter ATP-binding protein n=1 Tax=Azotosporobacter soli TaxID=3055040 RepID=UPI0031FEFDE7